MQACARIGATHSVVFGGFSAKSLQERIIDAGAVAVITALFDAPDPNDCYRRTRSVIPQQALALTNSKLVHDHAAALVKHLGAPTTDNAAFITAAFEHLLTRPPSRAELSECEAFLKNQLEKGAKEGDVWPQTSLVRALLNHNDFLTVR